MIKLGITGGIGSGKSVVATIFQLHGIPVYTADEESKKLTDTSPIIKEKLQKLCGSNIYKDSKLDKKQLASIIFNNADMLREVNGIIHPEVSKSFLDWADRQTNMICAIESAILFESGFDKIVDYTLTVYAPLDIRLERIQKRDNVSLEAISKRIDNQLSDEIKKERADYIIINDNKTPLIAQASDIITSLDNIT
jgi:dephospho-CoA kinase